MSPLLDPWMLGHKYLVILVKQSGDRRVFVEKPPIEGLGTGWLTPPA